MSAEDLERYEADVELQLYQEYRDVFSLFRYSVETERRYYLTNKVDVQVRNADADVFYDVAMEDVWVWDKNRPSRIIPRADVHTTQDVTVEELKPIDDVPTTLPPDFVAPPPDETP